MKNWLITGIALLLIMPLLTVAGSCETPDWDKKKIDAEGGGFFAIWGSSSSDVFVVGVGGIILHYDGLSWSKMESGINRPILMGIWGRSSSDVFALSGYYILHYDGTDAS